MGLAAPCPQHAGSLCSSGESQSEAGRGARETVEVELLNVTWARGPLADGVAERHVVDADGLV